MQTSGIVTEFFKSKIYWKLHIFQTSFFSSSKHFPVETAFTCRKFHLLHSDFVRAKHFCFTNNAKKVNPLVPILVTNSLNSRISTFIFSLGWILRIDAPFLLARRKHKVLLVKNGQDYLVLPSSSSSISLPPLEEASKSPHLIEPSLLLL